MSAEPSDLAGVAVLLADPIRRAWVQHLDTHPSWGPNGFQPGTCPTSQRGVTGCDVAMEIFYCLPLSDRRNILDGVS